ncbi:carboxypeptidase regulatory-like domain-containing protein [bacterium]|nr:carboxypeptidase regulatory-like domain-containing protein [bacterium]
MSIKKLYVLPLVRKQREESKMLKKVSTLFLGSFMVLVIGILGGMANDSDDREVQKVPYSDISEKLGLKQAQTPLNIYWDDFHDDDDDSLSGNYSILAAELTAAGHTIVEKTVPITTSELAGFDVLIILDPELPLSSPEISDIQTWVNKGHGLFVVGENHDAFNQSTVNDLLNPYGIQFIGDANGSIANSFNPHPVTDDVSKLIIPHGAGGLLSGGTELGYTEYGELVLSVYESGGKVVVCSDSNTLENGFIGSYDEITFLHNTIEWLGTSKGSINGYVTDADTGNAIKWAFIIAIQKPAKKWTLTNSNGYYELADLPEGDWLVIVIKKGYEAGFAKVSVNPGETTTKDFQLEPKPE